MKPEMVELIKYRLERAKETHTDAKKYYESTSLVSTVNRIYYAMFYAANALLALKGFSSSKHIGVRSIFNREFVKKGLIDKKMGKFYSDMFDNRQVGDYKDFVTFDEKEVGQWLDDSNDFIEAIENIILKTINE